ncbi:MAG TPA: DUF2019 domain-containing protein [Roseiarcus sp.]|nr:DUF2019 domain-containing protein [Roseiarcus sp.]
MMSQGAAEPALADLVKAFRDLADELGSAWGLGVRRERYRRTPERAARVARMNALIPELRSQAPAEMLTALMEDENIDTRTWAAMRFFDLDEELSQAAIAGLCEDVSTREAFDCIEHARTPPPKHPALSELNTDELTARFADACLRKFWARHAGRDGDPVDVELRNGIVREIHALRVELKRQAALERLLPLLNSDNITQRADAARATLQVAPERAVQVLEAVASKNDPNESPWAWQSLDSYRRGESFW